MPATSARVSGTVCAYHAASLIVTDARASRRRCAALVAYGPKSKLGCCGSGVGGGLSSSAIGRRCMRLARMSRAKASGLSNDFIGVVGEAQQQESDQRDRNLDAHG